MKGWGKKLRIANLSLGLGSVVLTLAFLELFWFPYYLPHVPLRLQFAVPEEIRLLCQSSKKGLIPKNYIAIVGDSYAQGLGDWLLNVDPGENLPFHSAHLIQQKTGRDVISFGQSGSGSLEGLVGNPVSWINFLNASRFGPIEDPEIILVYFYEGNDLSNNVEDIRFRYLKRFYDPGRIYHPDYFSRFISREVVTHAASSPLPWTQQGFMLDFIASLIGDKPWKPEESHYLEGSVNRIRVNGKAVQVPNSLQVPALELSPPETYLGVYVFQQSLKYLRNAFPESRVLVVYIPSVLSSYEILSPYVSAQVYMNARPSIYSADRIREKSEKIQTMVQSVADDLEIPLVDTRPSLRKAAHLKLLHGPKNWRHFNRAGYRVLTDTLLGPDSPLRRWLDSGGASGAGKDRALKKDAPGSRSDFVSTDG